jgi:fructan beta-fructosidase
MPFNQMMCFPCELTLRSTSDGNRLFFEPVREVESLREHSAKFGEKSLAPGENPLASFHSDLADIRMEVEARDATEIGLSLRGVKVLYDVKAQQLSCKGRKAGVPLKDGRLRLRALVDRTSIEIFAQDGLVFMPISAVPRDGETGWGAFVEGGTAKLNALEAHTLRSIWDGAVSRK